MSRVLHTTRLRGRRPVTWRTMLGIVLVPVTVAGVFLWGLWNPEERLESVSAAVVNLDEPVEVDGQLVPLGRVLAGELIGSDGGSNKSDNGDPNGDMNFDWVLTDEADGGAGLDDGRYATVITIPENFSEAATSLSGEPEDAEQATIDIATSDRGRLLDGALSTIVTETATSVINQQLGEQFVGNIFVGMTELGDGISEAADGAERLAEGGSQLADGADEFAAGTGELASGTSQLAAGTGELAAGTGELAAGAGELASGADGLAAGAAELAAGSSTYADGASDYAAGMRGLADGNDALASGVEQYTGGANQTITGLQQAAGAAIMPLQGMLAGMDPESQEAQELGALVGQLQYLSSDPAGEIAELVGAGDELAAGARESATGAAQLADGADGLASGARDLATGTSELAGGIQQFSGGVGALSSGVGELAAGANELSAGAGELSAGVPTLVDGAEQLADGTRQTADGADDLATGLGSATEEIPNYSDAERERMSEIAVSPVKGEGGSDELFNASGVPLFAGIALWAGALALVMLLAPLWGRTQQAAKSIGAITLRSALPALVLGAAQGAIAGIALPIMLGYSLPQFFGFFAFALITGISFALIVQGLSALLGGVGRFVAFALLIVAFVVGIVSTVPGPLAALGDASPIGAAFSGFQAIAAQASGAGTAMFLLIVWGLAGLVLTGLGVARARRRPALATWREAPE